MGTDALSSMPDKADSMVRVSYHYHPGRLLWKFPDPGKSRMTLMGKSRMTAVDSSPWHERERLAAI
jgi:hypothetical protein